MGEKFYTLEQLQELKLSDKAKTNPEFAAKVDRYIAALQVDTPEVEKPEKKKEKEEISEAESLMRGAVQGASFNFGDEIMGAGTAIGNILSDEGPSAAYTRGRDETRAANTAAERANPMSYLGGEVGGGMLMPGGAAVTAGKALAKGAGMVNKIRPLGASMITGGAAGGAAGLGASESETLAGNLEDTAIGAGIGATISPALSAVGSVIGKAGGGTLKTIGRKMFESPGAKTDRQVADDLFDEGYTNAQEVYDAAQQRGGRLATLGPTVQGDAVAASKKPGPGRKIAQDAVNEDQAGQTARLTARVEETINAKWSDYHQFVKDIKSTRKADATEAYEAAYAKEFQPTQKLLELQNIEPIAEALKDASKIVQVKLSGSEVNLAGGKGNRLELFDQTKRSLDDQIGKAQRAGEMDKARRLIHWKNEWVNELDIVVPEYANARAIYGGGKAIENAAQLGRSILKDSNMFAEDLAELTRGFGKAELEGLKMGLVRGMIDIMENSADNANSAGRLFATTRHRKVIDSIYPDSQSMKLLEETVEDENARSRLRNSVMGGSETAERQAAMSRFDEQRDIGGATSVMEFVRRVANVAINPERMSEEDYAELSRKLFNKLSYEEIVRIMGTRAKKMNPEPLTQGAISGRLGVSGGNVAAGALAEDAGY